MFLVASFRNPHAARAMKPERSRARDYIAARSLPAHIRIFFARRLERSALNDAQRRF